MESFYLDNGTKIIYENRNTRLVSFSIAIEAGAAVEKIYGLAHVVEHMIFKGTHKRSEKEINNLFNKYFGFYNAMTNYPYVVYYGTTLKDDIEKGFELYTDILTNPSFEEAGFLEEMKVIKTELKQWGEDKAQHCEDVLFHNAFKKRRIKELIIGNDKTLDEITIEDVKNFYNKHYNPKNTVISFVGGISREEVKLLCTKHLTKWKKETLYKHTPIYELNEKNIFLEASKSGNLQYIFPIDHLNHKEVKALRILAEYLGGGTSSLLYEKLRTEKALVYDVTCKVKNERDIKLLTVKTSSFDKDVLEIKKCIDEILYKLMYNLNITQEEIKSISKGIKRKVELFIEKSVAFAMESSVHEIMYGDYTLFLRQFENLDEITLEDIKNVAGKVLGSQAVQIIAKN